MPIKLTTGYIEAVRVKIPSLWNILSASVVLEIDSPTLVFAADGNGGDGANHNGASMRRGEMDASRASQWQPASMLIGDIRDEEVRAGVASEAEDGDGESGGIDGSNILHSMIEQILANFSCVRAMALEWCRCPWIHWSCCLCL